MIDFDRFRPWLLQYSRKEPKCVKSKSSANIVLGEPALPHQGSQLWKVARIVKVLRHCVDRVLHVESESDVVSASYRHRMRYVIGKICEPLSTEELSLPRDADNTVSTGDGSNLFIGEISRRGKDRGHRRM